MQIPNINTFCSRHAKPIYHPVRTLIIAGFHMTSSKFKTKELSALLSFYHHEVFQLKTSVYTNFHFENNGHYF